MSRDCFQYKYSQKKRVYFKPVNSNDFHRFFKLVQTISYRSVCLETIGVFFVCSLNLKELFCILPNC